MTSFNTPASEKITASEIPEQHRSRALPRHFGQQTMAVETAIFGFMRLLARDYEGGYWKFFDLSNGGFYMALQTNSRFDIWVEGNGYQGTLSADAAGIAACLFAFSHLSLSTHSDEISKHFYRLRDFALQHAEAKEILAAID